LSPKATVEREQTDCEENPGQKGDYLLFDADDIRRNLDVKVQLNGPEDEEHCEASDYEVPRTRGPFRYPGYVEGEVYAQGAERHVDYSEVILRPPVDQAQGTPLFCGRSARF